MGVLRPDMGKLVYFAIGVALATYTGIAKYLPKR